MEQQRNAFSYKQEFIRLCLELAIVQLEKNRVALTSIEKAELENFIRLALVGKTDEHISAQEQLYKERLLLLMDLAATRLRLSNQAFDEILESLCPWHPWY